MKAPAKPTLDQRIAEIFVQLTTRWDRLNNQQRTQWNAYADFRLLSAYSKSKVARPGRFPNLSGRQYFIFQNFYRKFYGPLNAMGTDPIMLNPIFAPSEHMDIWGPKGEWSNKDIIQYPVELNIKTHFAIIWESAPLIPDIRNKRLNGSTYFFEPGGGLRLMLFTTLNGDDQDTTIPYREQFGKIPKAGDHILASVGFANKLTGVVSNFITQEQEVVPNP